MILVTAATGIVSGYLLQILERLTESGNVRIDGRRVVIKASARSKAKAEKLAAERPGRGTVVLDFDKPREMKSAFEGVDSVFISTGYTGDMVHQTQWLIDAAREAGVTHCVHLGGPIDDLRTQSWRPN